MLGVSDDTLRRWIEADRVPARPGVDGRTSIEGADLAVLAKSLAEQAPEGFGHASRATSVSARNRLRGIVTTVKKDAVMAPTSVVDSTPGQNARSPGARADDGPDQAARSTEVTSRHAPQNSTRWKGETSRASPCSTPYRVCHTASLATATWALAAGARMVRSHDVRATVQAAQVVGA